MSRPRPPGGRSAPYGAKAARTDAAARRGAGRGRPARAVKCGAVQPASATMRHQSSTGEVGVPVLVEPGVDLGAELVASRRSVVRRRLTIVSVPSSSSALSRMILPHVGVVEAVELLREVERLGEALAVGPVGAEEDALDADEVGQRAQVLLVVRRDPHVAADRVERVLRERPTASGWPASAGA